MKYLVVLFIGVLVGTYSGHIVVLKDDGTVCAEVK